MQELSGLDVLIGGIDFGEGPRWHDSRLWYSDFYQHGVFAVSPAGEREQVVALDDHPSGLGWLPDGRLLLVAMKARQVRRREADGSIVLHADLSELATGRCNDMVVAVDGTAYVGNFGSDLWAGEAPRTAVLALVRPDGSVEAAAEELAFPNGTVITPDGATLIVGESMGRRYTAFDVGAEGRLSGRRVWAELGDIGPDGCTLDAEGAIWCADALNGAVVPRARGRRDHAPRRPRPVGVRVRAGRRRRVHAVRDVRRVAARGAGGGLGGGHHPHVARRRAARRPALRRGPRQLRRRHVPNLDAASP